MLVNCARRRRGGPLTSASQPRRRGESQHLHQEKHPARAVFPLHTYSTEQQSCPLWWSPSWTRRSPSSPARSPPLWFVGQSLRTPDRSAGPLPVQRQTHSLPKSIHTWQMCKMYKFILSGGLLGEFECDKRWRSAAAVLEWGVLAKPQLLGADPHKPQTEQHHSFPSPGWNWRAEKASQTLSLQICAKSTSKAKDRLCIRCGSDFLPSTWRSGGTDRASLVSQSGPGRGQYSEWNRFNLFNVPKFLQWVRRDEFSRTWYIFFQYWQSRILLQVQREFIETDDALHHGYLNRFKSGGVVVGELLEDMSDSETEGAQAVQDGSLEAWKRIWKCGVFKYKWDQTKIWPEIPHKKTPKITTSLTSHGSKAGIYMKRVPVPTQAVQSSL